MDCYNYLIAESYLRDLQTVHNTMITLNTMYLHTGILKKARKKMFILFEESLYSMKGSYIYNSSVV